MALRSRMSKGRPAPADVPEYPDARDLLDRAFTEPGLLLAAYSHFYRYSFGNQLLALVQCLERGIEPGPIATFNRWKELGRSVRKGERALALCQPVSWTVRETQKDGEVEEKAITRFQYRRNWFVLSQTDGEPYTLPETPGWDLGTALAALDVMTEVFSHPDGNRQGYSIPEKRVLAVSILAVEPLRTTFHELGHILLGHSATFVGTQDGAWQEIEAEAVALLCQEALGLGEGASSRGYIQTWLPRARIEDEQRWDEHAARQVFKAADAIIKAGRAVQEGGEE